MRTFSAGSGLGSDTKLKATRLFEPITYDRTS